MLDDYIVSEVPHQRVNSCAVRSCKISEGDSSIAVRHVGFPCKIGDRRWKNSNFVISRIEAIVGVPCFEFYNVITRVGIDMRSVILIGVVENTGSWVAKIPLDE